MAIYFDKSPSLQTMAGQQIGQSLGGGLQQLAQFKLQNLQQRHQQQLKQQDLARRGQQYQMMGLPPSLASLPDSSQKAFIENWAQEGGLQQLMGGLQGQQQAPQQGLMQGLGDQSQVPMQQFDQQMPQEQTQGVAGQTSFESTAGQPSFESTAGQPRRMQDIMQQTDQMKAQEPWQILQRRPMGKIQRELYRDARKEQQQINKTLNPRIEQLEKAASAAKKDDATIENLKKIVKSGKLTSAGWARFRKAIDENARFIGSGLGSAIGAAGGAVLGSIIPGVGTFGGGTAGGTTGAGIGQAIAGAIPKFAGTPLDQAFKKSVYGFFKNVKDWFGARIPVGEAQIFLDTLPTLEMDDSAKLAVLDQMEQMGNLAEAQNRAKNEVLREHGGNAPYNLFELIDERTKNDIIEVRNGLKSTIDRLLSEAETPREQFRASRQAPSRIARRRA